MKERTSLLVSNYWHKPGIAMRIIHCPDQAPEGGIMLEMPLEDFRKAVLAELPHSLKLWTSAQMEAAMDTAMTAVVDKLKATTTGAL